MEMYENEKKYFNPFPGKTNMKVEAILKMYELFVYDDMHCFTNFFGENVLTIATP
jgi:hypothetical protein